MSLPTKRSLSNDSETKDGPNPQKIKSENTPTKNPTRKTSSENKVANDDPEITTSPENMMRMKIC